MTEHRLSFEFGNVFFLFDLFVECWGLGKAQEVESFEDACKEIFLRFFRILIHNISDELKVDDSILFGLQDEQVILFMSMGEGESHHAVHHLNSVDIT